MVPMSTDDVDTTGLPEGGLPPVPQFGQLLSSHIASVPDLARPAFLAGLERSAAARYRRWAEDLPDHAEVLLECSRREDEIAELVSGLFPVDPAVQDQVDAALPAAVQLYYEVFAPHPPLHQLYLQSEAELQGAMAWVHMAERLPAVETEQLTHVRETLARCTELERQSSVDVKRLLAEELTYA